MGRKDLQLTPSRAITINVQGFDPNKVAIAKKKAKERRRRASEQSKQVAPEPPVEAQPAGESFVL
jgi:hypothetical protein